MNDAVKNGAKVLAGGKRNPEFKDGNWYDSVSQVRRTECVGQSASDRVRRTECVGQSASDRVRRTECVGQSASDRVRRTECVGQSASDRVRRSHEPPNNGVHRYEPTVLANIKHDMKIVNEEVFGPVALLLKFSDEDKLVEQVNSTA